MLDTCSAQFTVKQTIKTTALGSDHTSIEKGIDDGLRFQSDKRVSLKREDNGKSHLVCSWSEEASPKSATYRGASSTRLLDNTSRSKLTRRNMALPLPPGLTPPEIAFLCEMELITIIPRQRLEGLELLGVRMPLQHPTTDFPTSPVCIVIWR